MDQMMEQIINLGIGTMSSIIGGIILAMAGVSIGIAIKRKSRIKISGSKVKGDIVQGDKKKGYHVSESSRSDKRSSEIFMEDTEVEGDIVQGDKEI